MAQADLLGPRRAVQRRDDHRLVHDLARGSRLRQMGVIVHQRAASSWSRLPQLTPIRTGFVMPTSDFDDGGELLVLFLATADVAGVDAVFVEQFGACRIFAQQPVAVEVKVADQRHGDTSRIQALADRRHSGGGLLVVDGDPYQFRTCLRQFRHLGGGRRDVGGIGVGHRLHHDGRVAADRDGADADGDAGTARDGKLSTSHGVISQEVS